MPDIAMCQNNDCPKKDECYRFKAKPDDKWQCYGDFAPNADAKCENFMTHPRKQSKTQEAWTMIAKQLVIERGFRHGNKMQ